MIAAKKGELPRGHRHDHCERQQGCDRLLAGDELDVLGAQKRCSEPTARR